MPYVRCPGCALDTYSAAGHSTKDLCPRCGAPLLGVARSARAGGGATRLIRLAATPEIQAGPEPDRPAAAVPPGAAPTPAAAVPPGAAPTSAPPAGSPAGPAPA